MLNRLDPSQCPVAAVCGNQVRIYGIPVKALKGEIRPLVNIINFRHHGAALQYAKEYDDRSTVPPTDRRMV